MSRLEQLIQEIHRRSLWQVLGIYIAVSWAVIEAADVIVARFSLPEWVYGAAIMLLLVGLPIVLATAFIQEGFTPRPRHDPTLLPAEEEVVARTKTTGVRRLLTWRNAIGGGIVAFALWGVAATGLLLFGNGTDGKASDVADNNKKSVAVLPFVNMSADPDNEYFSDGITETIITHLSKIADLKVISRTSVMQYKQIEKNLRQIADELGVATILEGSVQRAEDRVQITAQLIDAESDVHLWAEQYNRELTDVFEIQSDVAKQIADALQATLTPRERENIEARPTENLEAYNSYLLGRYYWNKRTADGLTKAIEYFEEAIEQDDTYALAYAGLADCHVLLPVYANRPLDEAYPNARSAALRALELDGTLAEAHTALAAVKGWSDWDWSGADAEFKRAIQLSPGYATAHLWYAWHLLLIGRIEEAIAENTRARELDPLSLIINADLGHLLYFARRYEEATQQIESTLELDQSFWVAHAHLGQTHVQLSMFDEAVTDFQRAVTLSQGHARARAMLGYTYGVAGMTDDALKVLDELMDLSQHEPVPSLLIAIVHAGLGQDREAFEWLEKAYEKRDSFWTAYFLKADPWFDRLRSDPRTADVLRRMGLE